MMSACCSNNTHINIAAPHPAMGYGTAIFFLFYFKNPSSYTIGRIFSSNALKSFTNSA